MVDKQDWQGRVGQEWADKVEGLDKLLGPVGDAGISVLGNVTAKRVLDVGCGAGSTSRALGELGADVTGVDVSKDLLAVAEKLGGARYILADAAADPLAGPYDAIYSRCGAMFFDDPVAGWRHIRGEAAKGADLSIVCWTAAKGNAWASVPLRAARPILGAETTQPMPAGAPGPFAWAEPEIFEPILKQAGWSNLAWTAVEKLAELTTGDDPDPIERAIQFTVRIGPLASRLAGVPPEIRAEIAEKLRTVFQDYLDGDAVRVPTKAWIITATA